MSFKFKRFIVFVIAVICMFSMMIGCESDGEIDSEVANPSNNAVEKVENKVEKNTEPVEEQTESPIENPTEKVVEPTKPKEESKKENSEPKMVSLGTFKLTAYCDCYKCCNKTDGITATGTVATQGRTIAVDPKVIPYGTKVVINGHTYVAEDCGGAIKSNRIDIFFSSHQAALEFGVQKAEVFIISK